MSEVNKQEFFETLFPDLNGQHHIEIRILPRGYQTFCRTIDEAVDASDDAGQNIFFGVSLREEKKGDDGHWTLKGDEKHSTLIGSLWADVDAKDFENDKYKAGEPLARFQYEPSVVVDSGNGFHCYWLLKEPETVTDENRHVLRGILLGIAQTLGGDTKCRDLSRILRVPCTSNMKDPKGMKPVEVIRWHPERRYNLDDFEHYYVEESKQNANTEPLPTGEEDPSRISGQTKDFLAIGAKEGERNHRLFTAACDLKGCGYGLETATEMLLGGAGRCQPKMSIDEAKKTIESAWKGERLPARPEVVGKVWRTPQPIPDCRNDVVPFDCRLLPESLQPWIRDIAERMQCPPDFPAVGAMVALSVIVGRRVGIRPKVSDDWLVVPNLWGGIIGKPGIMKTPALQEVLKPLDKLEAGARQVYEEAVCDYESDKLVAEAQVKHAKDQINKAVKRGEDPHTIAKAALAEDTQAPIRRRYRTNDPTVEKLGALLNENSNGLLLFRDELTGFLRKLDKDGHESDRAFYLEAWNGTGKFVFDRIGRGTLDIEAACISVLGGIQPGPMASYMSRAAQGGRDDDGLVQRFQLVVYPDPPGVWQNIDRQPDLDARHKAFEVFERLDCIESESVGAEVDQDDAMPYLRFTPEAQEWFTEWRTELEHRLRDDTLPPMLEAHMAKFRSLIPSLALLIHLADVSMGPVGEDPLLKACAWAEYLESHARRVYAPALSPETVASASLAEHILKGDLGGIFTARVVQRKGWTDLVSRESVAEALDVLEELDWVRPVQVPTDGRSRVEYHVNPHILGGGSNG
jgi:hypothetical protein